MKNHCGLFFIIPGIQLILVGIVAALPQAASALDGMSPGPQSQQQLSPAQKQGRDMPTKFVAVKPLERTNMSAALPARPSGELRISKGRFFTFALPPGWRVGEDGQFALTLHAPDNKALTLMVGNAGMPLNYPPQRFAYDKLSAIHPQNLQLGAPRQAKPPAGFRQSVEFDVSYSANGVACRGVAKVSVAPAYDSSTMAMTAALSTADQWGGLASWLPKVADQVSALNGAAFGMRGIMQQNLQNSVAYGEAAQQYREWSQKNWQQVTDKRNASQDRKNLAVRENLGGAQTFTNPYGTNQSVEMPITHKYFWMDRQGRFVGTDDPSANPNEGSTSDWRKMERMVR